MYSLAAPSQSYVKTHKELEAARRKLLDAAFSAHKQGEPKTAMLIMDNVLELDSQLIPVRA